MDSAAPSARLPLRHAALLTGAAQALFTLAYPFVVYWAYTRLGARWLGGLLLALYAASLLLRARARPAELLTLARQHWPLVALIAAGIAADARAFYLFLPTGISAYLLFAFARTLRRGPPMIERVARRVEEDLPEFCLPYCRTVTGLWCVFLALNTLATAWLALAAPLGWWALYTGLLFYLLLAALMTVEWVVRKLWFRYYGDGPLDRAFQRLFPPERTANGRRSLAYLRARGSD